MIDTRLRLEVRTSVVTEGEAFTDVSGVALDFGRDTFTMMLGDGTSYLYAGYVKPFAALFANLHTANTNTSSPLIMEYWNGTTWTELVLYDRSNGLQHSGFMTWTAPSDWAAVEVDGSTAFYVRFSTEGEQTSTVVAGLNLVYADDYDLQTEFPAVSNTAFIPEGEDSHIKTHVAVRNELTQALRNKGLIKTDVNGNWQNITPWDLHDIEEVRQSATFLALAKIFFNYSDNPGDHWSAKSKFYNDKYKSAIDLVKVSYDKDDDGVVDTDERMTTRVVRMYR